MTDMGGSKFLAALSSNRPCFLDLPEWRSILVYRDSNVTPSIIASLSDDFYNTTSCLPGLLYDKNNSKSSRIESESLVTRLLELEHSLDFCVDNLNSKVPPPEVVESAMENDIYPLVYRYVNNSIASLYCHYAAVRIITHQALGEIRGLETPRTIMLDLVNQICQSVEFGLSSGVYGTFYILFGLKTAISEAEGPLYYWIRDHLSAISKEMAVDRTAPNTSA
jgi:hypothetical protein